MRQPTAILQHGEAGLAPQGANASLHTDEEPKSPLHHGLPDFALAFALFLRSVSRNRVEMHVIGPEVVLEPSFLDGDASLLAQHRRRRQGGKPLDFEAASGR